MVHLGGRHGEAAPGALEDRSQHRPLLLEGVHRREVQLHGERRDVHHHDGPLGPGDLPLFEGLDDVALAEILVVGEADAALEALRGPRGRRP